MKVAPKSSIRPFLHRALHLFASFSIVGRTLTEKDCPVFKHPLIICVAGFSISSPKVSQTEVTANCCGKNRELHKLTHSGECLDARVKKRLGRKVKRLGEGNLEKGEGEQNFSLHLFMVSYLISLSFTQTPNMASE